MTYKFTEEQELWLRDLETTEEPQTIGSLHRTAESQDGRPAGFCCLGRGCYALGIEGRVKGDRVTYDNYEATLPTGVKERLRLRSNCGDFQYDVNGYHSLADLNDRAKFSFKQIADFIRSHPENVFLPPEDAS